MKKKVYENFTVVDNYYIDDIECKPEYGLLNLYVKKTRELEFDI